MVVTLSFVITRSHYENNSNGKHILQNAYFILYGTNKLRIKWH